MWQSGDYILHYKLLATLGTGGMGQVMKAFDCKLERCVALKFLLTDNPEDIEWLEREARALAYLDHPNISTIYTIESYEKGVFLVMPYYEGKNLQELIASTPPDIESSLDIFKQTLHGLNYAHKHGIVHRDVKPANLFITTKQTVKILDFGIATFVNSKANVNKQVIGTISYSSPEQLRNEAISAQSDIWSLGIILFEMLTGILPFKGDFPEVIGSILHEKPRDLRRYLAHEQLAQIIDKCLQKNRQDRFQDCEDLLQNLEDIRLQKGLPPSHTNAQSNKPLETSQPSRAKRQHAIGREKEIQDIKKLLQQQEGNLITITGIGGIGKTTVAQAIYNDSDIALQYREGCYFTNLDNLQDITTLPFTLGQLLNINTSKDTAWEDLYTHFAEYPMLLVLDHLEHIRQEITPVINTLIRHCPMLTIMITSREVLNLEDEIIYELRGLHVPDRHDIQLIDYAATRFFLNKARRLQPNFSAEKNKHAIIQICHELEGWPLGIELAAAWVRQLSVQEIAAKISENLDILTTRVRKTKTRHESARAAFNYSWDLLAPESRDVLVQLAIFRSGFDTKAAYSVAQTNLHGLAELVDKSLLNFTTTGRYTCHLLIYSFCHEKLLERSDFHEIAKRHAHYFLTLSQEATCALHSQKQPLWLDRLEQERSNIDAAITWYHDNGDITRALELVLNLITFWYVHHHLQYAITWIRKLRSSLPETLDSSHLHYLYARSMCYEGDLLWQAGLRNEALTLYHKSYNYAKDSDNILQQAQLSLILGSVKRLRKEYSSAREMIEQSMAIFTEHQLSYQLVRAKGQLALIEHNLGNHDQAITLLLDCLNETRHTNHQAASIFYSFLGVIQCHQNNYTAAEQEFQMSINLLQHIGERRGEAIVRAHLGWLHTRQAQHRKAASFYHQSLTLSQQKINHDVIAFLFADVAHLFYEQEQWEISGSLFAAAHKFSDEERIYIIEREIDTHYYTDMLRDTLGTQHFKTIWQAGQQLSRQQAINTALENLQHTFDVA